MHDYILHYSDTNKFIATTPQSLDRPGFATGKQLYNIDLTKYTLNYISIISPARHYYIKTTLYNKLLKTK